jgi:hypothetical protein
VWCRFRLKGDVNLDVGAAELVRVGVSEVERSQARSGTPGRARSIQL